MGFKALRAVGVDELRPMGRTSDMTRESVEYYTWALLGSSYGNEQPADYWQRWYAVIREARASNLT